MEEKKVTKISLSTFLLIIAIMAIIIMGYFLFTSNKNVNEMLVNQKELNNKISKLEDEKLDLTKVINEYENKKTETENKDKEENISKNTESTSSNNTIIKEVEKNVNVKDVIALGYNNIVFLVNGKPYYIPVFNRDNNYESYKVKEVANVSGKVSKVRMFYLGTDPSESTFLIYENGGVEALANMGDGLESHQGVLAEGQKATDLIEENGIVYAILQNGEKFKVAERYPGM